LNSENCSCAATPAKNCLTPAVPFPDAEQGIVAALAVHPPMNIRRQPGDDPVDVTAAEAFVHALDQRYRGFAHDRLLCCQTRCAGVTSGVDRQLRCQPIPGSASITHACVGGFKRAEIFPFARSRIFLARIQPIFAGFQFPNHNDFHRSDADH
jgi:hypothetical protein